MTEELGKKLNKITQRLDLPFFRLMGDTFRGEERVGSAFYADHNSGMLPGGFLDIQGKTVAVAHDEKTGEITIYSEAPATVIDTKEPGWERKLEPYLAEAFSKPGQFASYECEAGRRESFNKKIRRV